MGMDWARAVMSISWEYRCPSRTSTSAPKVLTLGPSCEFLLYRGRTLLCPVGESNRTVVDDPP